MTKAKSTPMLVVENRKRDSKHLGRVWRTKDGRRPGVDAIRRLQRLQENGGDEEAIAKLEAEIKKIPNVESFLLRLGSQDDIDAKSTEEDPVLQAAISVPEWAVELYRGTPTFRTWEAKGDITVRVAA